MNDMAEFQHDWRIGRGWAKTRKDKQATQATPGKATVGRKAASKKPLRTINRCADDRVYEAAGL